MKTQREAGMRWVLAGALAALASAGATNLHAAQDELQVTKPRATAAVASHSPRAGAESRSVTVTFGDLDLRSAAGVKTLYTRLKTASRTVCSPAASRDLAAHRDWAICYSSALDTAVAETRSDPVAMLHTERTGRVLTPEVASSK